MKKFLLITATVMAMSLVPATMMGQDATTAATAQTNQVRGKQHRSMDPEKMIEARVAAMTKRYNLTAEQQTALKKLLKEQRAERKLGRNGLRRQAGRLTETQRDSMRTAMKERREKYNAALKKILTSEQYQQYQKNVEANREKMQNRRRGRGSEGASQEK